MPQTQNLLRAIALTLTVVCSFGCFADDNAQKVEIDNVLIEEGLSGITWAIVGDEHSTTTGTSGLQDALTGVSFESDTRVHVGSLTKTLLATGVLRLASQGRIDLDAPVIEFLPELFESDPPVGFSDITIRQLLDHTAGISDSYLWQIFSERAHPDSPLVAAFPDPAEQLKVRSPPGSQFNYSNMGYVLLGMVIESATGRRYESYLDDHLLAPLGMHNSTFTFTTQAGDDTDTKLAWGHVDGGSRFAATPMYLRPAGQFTTTAADFGRLLLFLLGDGDIDGEAFVDPSLVAMRGKPWQTKAADAGLIAGYSLGLARRDRHGVVGYCHGGSIVGFAAMLCVFPEEQKAFAYSVNTDSETADYGRLDALFIRELGIAPANAPEASESAPDMSEWYGRYVLSPNRFQQFEYIDSVFGSVKIFADGGDLVLSSLQKNDRFLRPVGARRYSASDRTTTSHVFYRDDDEYYLSDGFSTFRKTSSAYLIAHWASAALGLLGLGWFFLLGIFSLVRLRWETIRRPGAPATIATFSLLTPIPFFFAQSFVALGDRTIASGLLSFVTLLLPLGMLATVMLSFRAWRVTRSGFTSFLPAVLVLQWCAVLFVNGLLPLRLWAL